MRIENIIPDPPAIQTEITEATNASVKKRVHNYVPDVCANCPDSSTCPKASDRFRGRYADNPPEDDNESE